MADSQARCRDETLTGFRFWFIRHPGVLVGPGEHSGPWPAVNYAASCVRGCVPPGEGCECGAYVVPERAALLGLLDRLMRSWDGQAGQTVPVAVGRVIAQGPFLPEIDESVQRASSACVQHLAVEAKAGRMAAAGLKHRYGVPVDVGRSSGRQWLRELARSVL